jgi:hypothetical protein
MLLIASFGFAPSTPRGHFLFLRLAPAQTTSSRLEESLSLTPTFPYSDPGSQHVLPKLTALAAATPDFPPSDQPRRTSYRRSADRRDALTSE